MLAPAFINSLNLAVQLGAAKAQSLSQESQIRVRLSSAQAARQWTQEVVGGFLTPRHGHSASTGGPGDSRLQPARAAEVVVAFFRCVHCLLDALSYGEEGPVRVKQFQDTMRDDFSLQDLEECRNNVAREVMLLGRCVCCVL